VTIIHAIVALDLNDVIGDTRTNDLPWRSPGDLKNFKRITDGEVIVMGRRTFESLPNGPLPNRRNVVVSRTMTNIPGVTVIPSMKGFGKRSEHKRIFIIGGAGLFAAAWHRIDYLHMTRIGFHSPGDLRFPITNPESYFTKITEDVNLEPYGHVPAIYSVFERRDR